MEAQDFKPKMQVAVLSRKVIKVSYKSKKMSEIKGADETGAKLIREKEEEKVSKNGDGQMVTANLQAEFRSESSSVEIAQMCEQHRGQLGKKNLQVGEGRREWKHALSLQLTAYAECGTF